GSDDALVGVTLFAIVVDDACAVEARSVLGVETIVADRIGDGRVDAAILQQASRFHPDAKVIETMAGCRMHKTGTGVVGDVFAIEQRHVEIVATSKTPQRVGAGDDLELISRHGSALFEADYLGLGEDFASQLVSNDQLVADLGPVLFWRFGDFV